ncbi:MAG: hypothetical protein ACT6RP_05175 [Roseateles sp.]
MVFQALALATAGALAAAAAPPSQPTPWAAAAFGAMRDADTLPADAGDQPAPTTLVWRLQSREAGVAFESQVQSMTLMPGRAPGGTTSRHVHSDATGPLWCFETTGTRFGDGSWGFSGRLLDARCQSLLAEPRHVIADGTSHGFHGRLANGKAIAIELLARRFALPPNFIWIDVGIDQTPNATAPAGLRLLGPLGERLRVESGPAPADMRQALTVELVTTAEGGDHARIKVRLLLGEPARLLAEPQVVTRWGEPARLAWADPATGRRVELRLTPHRSASSARGDGQRSR